MIEPSAQQIVSALRGLAASAGRFVPARRLRWVLGPGVTVAGIEAALPGIAGDPRIATDGHGRYSLTTAGVLDSRRSRPGRRFVST